MSETGDTPLTPEEELLVAGRLAELGGPLEMPADVRDRLDSVIADLVAERSTEAATAARAQRPARDDVLPAARRRWPRVVLAAAAVLVVGYGVGTVADGGSLSVMSGGSDSSDSAADRASAGSGAATDREALRRERRREPTLHDAPGTDDGGGHLDSLTTAATARSTVRIRSDRLDNGVRRALAVLAAGERVAQDGRAQQHAYESAPSCPPPSTSAAHDDALEVRFDGEPAVLVAHGLGAKLVEVTVYTCTGVRLDGTVVRGGS